jgi:hypothetical protein
LLSGKIAVMPETQLSPRDVRLMQGLAQQVTAEQVTPEEAAQAHRDAWHPSTFTDRGMRGASQTWPYRPGLHVLVRAPDGTLAATTIIWLDERNGTAEFEPVGTQTCSSVTPGRRVNSRIV